MELSNSTFYPQSPSTKLTVLPGIVNETEMLLTLRAVNITFGPGEANEESLEHVLSPKGTPYVVKLTTEVSGADLLKFRAGILELPVVVCVQFDNTFGVSCSQTIGYYGSVKEGGRLTLREVRKTKAKHQNPN